MARKPLIDPNSLNSGGTTPLSTISRIVQRDREISGRGGAPDQAPNDPATPSTESEVAQTPSAPVNSLPSEPVTERTDEPTNEQTSEPVGVQTSETKAQAAPAAVEEPQVRPKAKRTTTEAPAPPRATSSARRQAAEEQVDQMGKSPMKQIGPRIPSEWDDWLEDYVYARRKSGLQKQDIIRNLVKEFIVSEIAKEGAEG